MFLTIQASKDLVVEIDAVDWLVRLRSRGMKADSKTPSGLVVIHPDELNELITALRAARDALLDGLRPIVQDDAP